MIYVLPSRLRVQCPSCGVPVDEVESAEPHDGKLTLRPCGHVTTPREMDFRI